MPLVRSHNAGHLIRDAIVLDLGDLRRQGEVILETARRRAEEIVAAAKLERQRLIEGAAAEGRAEGLADGLARGMAQGAEQGFAAALAERREALATVEKAWTTALEAVVAQREEMLAEARRHVLTLACMIAQKVTRRTVELAPTEVIQGQLEAVLALVMRQTRLVLEINPQDRELVQAALPGVLAAQSPGGAEGGGAHVAVVDRAGLPRGSLVAKLASSEEDGGGSGRSADGAAAGGGGIGGIGGGEIDASIHTQLARIIEVLLPGQGAGAGGGGGAGGTGAGTGSGGAA